MKGSTERVGLRAVAGLVAAVLVAVAPLYAEEAPEDGSAADAGEVPDGSAADAGEVPDEESVSDSTGPPPGVEVLRVRGRGISEIQTEVPSSVTSFDAATIEALGAQDVSDLSRVTPNVSIVQPGATQATFFIRGIGLSDFSSNAAGAVTIFQDDVAINAPAIQTGQLFDIEGVDIVRGPQGTGPFRNASAGAIRVASRRPSGQFGSSFRLTHGRYWADADKGAHRATIQEYEGAIEVPLADDLLSSRFAFKFRDDEPWKTNGCGEAPPPDRRPTRTEARDMGLNLQQQNAFISVCGERGRYIAGNEISTIPANLPARVGDAHNWAARGTFRLTPPETDWDVLLNAHGSRLDQQNTLGQMVGTGFLRFASNRPTLGNFGGTNTAGSANLYQEPDIAEEYFGRDVNGDGIGDGGLCKLTGTGANLNCTNPNAQRTLARRLNKDRPLDIRPYRGDYDRVGDTTRDAWGGFVSAEGELGGYDVFFLGSYDGYERTSDSDVDFSSADLLFQVSKDEAWQTYEELRIGGEFAATPFAWELGGYFLYEHLEGSPVSTIDSGAFQTEVVREFTQEIYSGGLWASFEWDFLQDLTLAGGVRLNYERKDLDYFVESLLISNDPLTDQQSETWLDPTGELVLTWHIDERAQAYARYTRGFKAGHYNTVATARLEELLADNETNDAWEAGLRGAFWDGRVRGGGAFFYYLYQDYQVFLFSDVPNSPPTLEIVNADEAELYGVEIEGQLRPLEGFVPRWMERLQLSANFSWLQGQYIDFTNQLTFRNGARVATRTFDFSGNSLANAPRYKVSGNVEWTLELGRHGFLIPRYDISWTDDQFFDAREGRGSERLSGAPSLPEYAVAQPAFFLHNVRLAYRTPSTNVEVALWVRNLTDEVFKSYAFDASRFAGSLLLFTGEPRTIGLDVVFTFP